MKRMLITTACVAVAASALGQGTINIGTAQGTNTQFITANGRRTAGTDWCFQFFYANGVVTDESALMPAGSRLPNTRLGTAAGVLPSAEFRLSGVNPPGGLATLQLRAWSSALGQTETEAFQNWLAGPPDPSRCYGRSALFVIDTANPFEVPKPFPAPIAPVFPGLSLSCVPEPSTIVLGVLGGAGALVVLRRRKQ